MNAMNDLATIENALQRLRCNLNSMAGAENRITRQLAECRQLAGDAKALLEETTN